MKEIIKDLVVACRVLLEATKYVIKNWRSKNYLMTISFQSKKEVDHAE